MVSKSVFSGLCAASLILGGVDVAEASPFLSIVGGTPHTIIDAGGTSYPGNDPANPVSNDAGLPTSAGGWPASPNLPFAGVVNGYLQVGGIGANPINLDVSFQYMGHGDASQNNSFEVFVNGSWTPSLFTNNVCGSNGCLSPVSVLFTGISDGMYIPFRYDLPDGTFVTNDGSGNAIPDGQGPNFFLGRDPYLAAGPDTVVYAGLTDRIESVTDHQDLGVRVSVPEPGTLALLGIGLLGFAPLLRRRLGSMA